MGKSFTFSSFHFKVTWGYRKMAEEKRSANGVDFVVGLPGQPGVFETPELCKGYIIRLVPSFCLKCN